MRGIARWLLDEVPRRHQRFWLALLLFDVVVVMAAAVVYLGGRGGRWGLLLGLYNVAFAVPLVNAAYRQIRQLHVRRKIDGQADDAGGCGDGVGEVDRAEG